MKFIKSINIFFLLIFFIDINSQSTFFIRYKDDVQQNYIDSKIKNKNIFPEFLQSIVNSKVEINYFAKSIAKNISSLCKIIKVQTENKLTDNDFHLIKDSDPNILYVQQANIYKIDFVPNDSLINEQWALSKIKAFDAWNISQGSENILLGIIDTGIDYLHPDLKNKIFYNNGELGFDNFGKDKRYNNIDDDVNGFVDDFMGWDFTDRVGFPKDTTAGDFLDWDNNPMDENLHGTFVAGIAGAEVNNNIGIAGVAPKIRIVNLRAFDPIGYGEEDDVAAAILYAVSLGVRVINMSFGDNQFSFVLKDVINYAYNQNVILVASSGNSGSNIPHYPSGYSDVICVGNSTQDDYVASSSNYGSTLDLVAPGTSIISTALKGGYVTLGGTSASAPFVSASAGLILSLQNFSNEEVKQILKTTCNDIGEPGWDIKSGAGRINLFKALSVLAPSVIKFNFPRQDYTTNNDTIPISLTVLSAYFEKFDLYYGSGLNPSQWNIIVNNFRNQISNQKIFTINTSNFKEGVYTLRLVVTLNNGGTTEERVNFYIERSSPKISLVSLSEAIINNKSTILGEIYTDKRAITKMFYRIKGTGDFNFISLDGFATNNQFVKQFHYGFIPKQLVNSNLIYEIYFEAQGIGGLKSSLKDSLNYFELKTGNYFEQSASSQLNFTLPKGTLFKEPVKFLGNSSNQLLFNEYYPTSNIYYSLYQFKNDSLIKIDSIQNKIPRIVNDFTKDGKPEIVSSIQRTGFIDEQKNVNEFKFNQKFVDSSGQFFPVLSFDFDNDGLNEIVSVKNDSTVGLWKVNSELQANLLKTFSNLSSIDSSYELNNLIFRNIEIADCNKDGIKELWFVDSDGDLISFSILPNNNFPLWNIITTDLTTTSSSAISAGDYDGDGIEDIAVLFHSNSIAPYHLLLIFNFKNNKFNIILEKTFIDQSEEYKSITFSSIYNSIKFVDIDNDNKKELVLCLYPNSYILKYDNKDKIIQYSEGVNNNAIYSGDINQNGVQEIGFQFSNGYRFFEFSPSQKTSTPNYFEGYSIDTLLVRLNWQGSGSRYFIYRGYNQNSFVFVDSTSSNFYIDTLTKINTNYFYKIQAVDYSKTYPYSEFSEIINVYAHIPAKIMKVESQNSNSIQIHFSEKVNNTINNIQAFFVNNLIYPNSISASSQFSYLLNFNFNLPTGVNKLFVSGIKDYYGSLIKNDSINFKIDSLKILEEFFVSSFEIINPYKVKISFNKEIDEISFMNKSNYNFEPTNAVVNLNIESDKKSISIELKNPVGSIGKEYKLKLENVFSSAQTGKIKINTGAGSYLVLKSFANDLSNVFVYPSPANINLGKITFANLPKYSEILIMNLTGKKIVQISENDGDGGVTWNLQNSEGNVIDSGIYFYRITMLNQNKEEVETKFGKFAVIK